MLLNDERFDGSLAVYVANIIGAPERLSKVTLRILTQPEVYTERKNGDEYELHLSGEIYEIIWRR